MSQMLFNNAIARYREYLLRFRERSAIFLLILIPQFCLNYLSPNSVSVFRELFVPLFWAFFWWMIASIFRSKHYYRLLLVFIGGGYLLLSCIEGYLLLTYQSLYNMTMASVLMATNLREAGEFWITAFESNCLVYILLVGGGMLLITYVVHRVIRGLHAKLVGLIAVFGWGILLVGVIYYYPKIIRDYGYRVTAEFFLENRMLTTPERIALITKDWIDNTNAMAESLAQIGNTAIPEVSVNSPFGGHQVILVLGESVRKDYMHCYGFPLANTPHIDSLIQNEGMIQFEDVISPASHTMGVIEELMTFHTLDMPGRWYETPLLSKVLQAAGYRTRWLSRQEQVSRYVQSVSAIAKTFDETQYLTSGYDDVLLDILPEPIKGGGRSFDVLHTLGSHVFFVERYPASYDRFTADSLRAVWAGAKQRTPEQLTMLAQYANTIYFGDYFLSQVIRRYAREDAIVIYLSDHAQALYDDPEAPDNVGHSLSQYGVRVPMFVYLSPSMRAKYPHLEPQIRLASRRRIMLDVFPYAIAGLLGIDFEAYDAKLDFFSTEYNNDRKRILRQGTQVLHYDDVVAS